MTEVQLIAVGAGEGETRLDRWFRRRFPELKHGQLEKLLRTGQIRIDGKRAEAGTRLEEGQTVRVPPLAEPPPQAYRPRKPVSEHDAADLQRSVLFRDDWVIVIDKPAGLAVQGGSGTTRHLDGMLDALTFDGERPRLVHRLDRDTSGVLMLARTVQAARKLGEMFRGKAARKYYWAVTIGVPEESRGRIDAPLAKLEGVRGERMEKDEDDGKPATSLYAVIDHAADRAAWVALWPLTGRTHQLRAHMAAIGTPILGDGKYGRADAQIVGEGIGKGLHLHARRLILPHPSGRGRIDVVAPLPPHMRETWGTFGFNAKSDGDPFAEIRVVKRLYKTVQVIDEADGFGMALDGRPVKTPGRLPVRLPTRALADAIADEWRAQGDAVRPATMPLMQLGATALDHIPTNRDAVRGITLRYAETDAICYRADQPAELVRLQAARWDPLHAWAAERYGAALSVATGIVPVAQPPAALAALAGAVDAMDDWRLTAFQSAAASSGSFVIALALMDGWIDADEAFRAAELDSEFEIDRWGEDPEATARRAIVAADLAAARRFHDLLGP